VAPASGTVRETGNSTALNDIIAQRERFLRFVERRIRDRAVAEDILQAAYGRAMALAGTLQNDDSATAWFYRILRNAIIDFYRHRAVESRILKPLESGVDSPQENVPERNICPCLKGAIDDLRPAYAEIIREVELAEDSTDSRGSLNGFARSSGIAAGNAAVRAHRARKALQQSLRRICGSCAGAGCLDCTCHQG
jgi:RNA polymerase sigma-70 factor (ECF subfamily)